MARSQKFTAAEVVEAIEAANGTISKAAKILNCSRRTIYRYRDRYKTVRNALERQRLELVLEARDRMLALARDPNHKGHYRALLKLLVTYDKEIDWSDKRSNELSTGDETPIQFFLPRNGREVEPE